MKVDWKKRKLYLKMYYEDGLTMYQIAEKLGVHFTTVSRTIIRAESIRCPFSPDCLECPLDECAIKEEYAVFVNKKPVDKRKCE